MLNVGKSGTSFISNGIAV